MPTGPCTIRDSEPTLVQVRPPFGVPDATLCSREHTQALAAQAVERRRRWSRHTLPNAGHRSRRSPRLGRRRTGRTRCLTAWPPIRSSRWCKTRCSTWRRIARTRPCAVAHALGPIGPLREQSCGSAWAWSGGYSSQRSLTRSGAARHALRDTSRRCRPREPRSRSSGLRAPPATEAQTGQLSMRHREAWSPAEGTEFA